MKFKESLLFAMIMSPKTEWEKGGIYRLILLLPYFLIVFTFGIIIALCVDLWVTVFETA